MKKLISITAAVIISSMSMASNAGGLAYLTVFNQSSVPLTISANGKTATMTPKNPNAPKGSKSGQFNVGQLGAVTPGAISFSIYEKGNSDTSTVCTNTGYYNATNKDNLISSTLWTDAYQNIFVSRNAAGNLSCSFNLYKLPAPPSNIGELNVSMLPDVIANTGQSFAQNTPLVDLNSYFTDKRLGYNYRDPANRNYFAISIGSGTNLTYITKPNQPQVLPLAIQQAAANANPNYTSYLYTSSAMPTISGLAQYCSIHNGYAVCQINVCSADPGMKPLIGTPQPGVAPTDAINPTATNYPAANLNCDPSKPNYGNTGGNVVMSNFDLYIYQNRFLPKTVTDLAINNAAFRQTGTGHRIRLQIPVNPSTTAKSSIPLNQYFKNSNASSVSATYAIVGQGNTPATIPNRSVPNWQPVQIGSPNTPVPNNLFSINGNNLVIIATNSSQQAIYQLTIAATEDGQTAYQTIYANISPKNISQYTATGTAQEGSIKYSIVPKLNSAWVYLPSNPSIPSSAPSTCKPGGTGYPICQYVTDVNNDKLNAVTPDMGWISFKNSVSSWPSNTYQPIFNNFTDGTTQNIQAAAHYFETNVKSDLLPGKKFYYIATYEMDKPVASYLAQIPINGIPGKTSRMTQLVKATITPFVKPFSYDGDNNLSFAGLQFDIEPFQSTPNAASYYRRVTDVLARHDKLFEAFLFASEAQPELSKANKEYLANIIMAFGPLGIFLHSSYDVGSTTDPNHYAQYQQNFGITPSTPDVDCHWSYHNPHGNGSSFVIGSYCNINIANTLHNNIVKLSFGMKNPKQHPSFTKMLNTYNGHFALSIPAEGSAENWSAEVIYNPTCSVTEAIGGNVGYAGNQFCAEQIKAGKIALPPAGYAYYIPSLPSNYTDGGTLAPGQKPAAGKFYYTPATGNPSAGTGSYSKIIIGANPNNDTNNNFPKPGVSQSGAPSNQFNYTDALLQFATGKVPAFPQGSAIGSPMQTNTTYNPHNVGLALYALSSEPVEGCKVGESHAGKANCLVDYPISIGTNPNPAEPEYQHYMNTAINCSSNLVKDMPSTVWGLSYCYTFGGATPPPPTKMPIDITAVTPSYASSMHENIAVKFSPGSDINKAKTCAINIDNTTNPYLWDLVGLPDIGLSSQAGSFAVSTTCYTDNNITSQKVSNTFSAKFGRLYFASPITCTATNDSASCALSPLGVTAAAPYFAHYKVILAGTNGSFKIINTTAQNGTTGALNLNSLTSSTQYSAYIVAYDNNNQLMSNRISTSFTTG